MSAARLSLLCTCLVCLVHCSFFRPSPWTRERALRRSAAPEIADCGDTALLVQAIDRSLAYLAQAAGDAPVVYGKDRYSTAELRTSLLEVKEKALRLGLSEAFFEYLNKNFVFYRSAASRMLFTGYYEAVLSGSRVKTPRYQYPIYRAPEDLVRIELAKFITGKRAEGLPTQLRGRLTPQRTVEPFYSRDEIDFGQALSGRSLEIVWVDDLIDLFFLHIQGSGVIEFEDGSALNVNFADSNGRAYFAIGALLLKEGSLSKEEVSMQSIKAYLRTHPDRLREILSSNPSYIFFREVSAGPIGSIGAPLTALRSIATDSALFPKGALALIRTRLPTFDGSGTITGSREVSQLVLNQDTGGAIKGPGRVDLFTGRGPDAELLAGHLKARGEMYFLIRRRGE